MIVVMDNGYAGYAKSPAGQGNLDPSARFLGRGPKRRAGMVMM